MIAVTRLNGSALVINATLIRYVESRPDTYITLTDGDRVIVQEPVDEVIRRVLNYQRQTRLLPDAA